VLDLYEIKFLYIDGTSSFHKRAKIVKQFCEGSEYRVLIISSVGSTGLNLSAASAVIFLVSVVVHHWLAFSISLQDQPWSAQDERQIRGRAHRQPQTKVVKCFHILADGTADIVLSYMAGGKKTMMETFLEKDAGKGTRECSITTTGY
jgi:SNF2 family DNA or RNA helicase